MIPDDVYWAVTGIWNIAMYLTLANIALSDKYKVKDLIDATLIMAGVDFFIYLVYTSDRIWFTN